MKLLADATPDDIRLVLQDIAEGAKPTDAVQTYFDVSTNDAEVVSKIWMTSMKNESLQTPDAFDTILSKEGALKRLAILALYADEEETQRKAVMDIAKLQKWVDDNPALSVSVLTGSMQEVDAFLLKHRDRLVAILPQSCGPLPTHP